ncbi:MAG: hypothetical protein Q8Q09_18530 [Deltaproteobacteria bacterium]|nr:hypothetical protein [Deltaproteobacteria bacterium]
MDCRQRQDTEVRFLPSEDIVSGGDEVTVPGALVFEIANCGLEEPSADRLEVRDAERLRLTLEYAPMPLRHGERATYWVPVANFASELAADLTIRLRDGSTRRASASALIRDPARERAMAACTACRGQWGRHGMAQREGCLCRTEDEGNLCEDAGDCEGRCLATGARVVVPEVRCPRGTRGCVPRPALRRAVGRCSGYRTTFGCRAIIGEGARNDPPTAHVRLNLVCAD